MRRCKPLNHAAAMLKLSDQSDPDLKRYLRHTHRHTDKQRFLSFIEGWTLIHLAYTTYALIEIFINLGYCCAGDINCSSNDGQSLRFRLFIAASHVKYTVKLIQKKDLFRLQCILN